MNMHVTDKQELCGAIDNAIARLKATKAGIYPSCIYDMDAQIESAESYAGYVRDIEEATGDLRVVAVEIAASLGNQTLSDSDRRAIRECETVQAVLADAQDWCNEVREEYAA